MYLLIFFSALTKWLSAVNPAILTKENRMHVKHKVQMRQNMSYIFTPPQPQGHVMSNQFEQVLDGLTVHVWLLYHHPNLRYILYFIQVSMIGGTELRTDRRTVVQTDGRSKHKPLRPKT